MSHTRRNWWAILGTDQTISQDRGDIKTLTWASPILLTVKSHTQHPTWNHDYIYSFPCQDQRGRSEKHKHRRQTLVLCKVFFSFLPASQVTFGKAKLVTHNHKTAVHQRTVPVNASMAKAQILNQCLKAFRLFIHNLTATTALDVRCIFGEEMRAGGWKCWIHGLSARWWRRGRGGSLSSRPHGGQNIPEGKARICRLPVFGVFILPIKYEKSYLRR